VMALVDTNCDPDPIDYVIACNDDALKSIKLVLEVLGQAIFAKKKELNLFKKDKEAEAKPAPKAEKSEEKKEESNE